MKLKFKSQSIAVLFLIVMLLNCVMNDVAKVDQGGSTEVVCVVGHIYASSDVLAKYPYSSGTLRGAPAVLVHLLPANFNPLVDKDTLKLEGITDSTGFYKIDNVPKGMYALNAIAHGSLSCFRQDITIFDSTKVTPAGMIELGNDTIRQPGTVVIKLRNPALSLPGYLYIPGSQIYVPLQTGNILTIDSIPSSLIDLACYIPSTNVVLPVTDTLSKIKVTPDSITRFASQNRPPVISSLPTGFDSIVNADSLYLDTIIASDPDDDSVFMVLLKGPGDMFLDGKTGIVRWSPTIIDTGYFKVIICASDGWGGNDTIVWNISVKSPLSLPPVIDKNPLSVTAVIGQTVQFSVSVTGEQSAFQWQFNNNNIPDAYDSIYLMKSVTVKDSGTYRCVVSNPYGVDTSKGAYLHVNDSGPVALKWENAANIPTRQNLYAVQFATALSGWAVGDSGTILHSDDGGITWEVQSSPKNVKLVDVEFSSAAEGWVVGDSGTILHTTNGGTTWTQMLTDTKSAFYSLFIHNDNTGWAVGELGTIAKISSASVNVLSLNVGGGFLDYISVFFTSPSTIWLVGRTGNSSSMYYSLFHSTDEGVNWITDSSDAYISKVFFVNDSTGFAINGPFNTSEPQRSTNVLQTPGGGNSWIEYDTIANCAIRDFMFFDERNGWLVGTKGTIARIDQSSKKFIIEEQSPTTEDLNGIDFFDRFQGCAVGNRGTIIRTMIK
jgi:photosystem II stability/assembly factor-like uncharacterized protein